MRNIFITAALLILTGTISAEIYTEDYSEHGLRSPSYPVNKAHRGTFKLRGDALIWKYHQGSLVYTEYVASPSTLPIQVGPNVKYHPGFRVGIGYILPYPNEFDMYANYTQFSDKISSTTNSSSDVQVYDVLSSQIGSTVSSASETFNIHYKVFDFMFGYKFAINRLHLHPFIGVRWNEIHESKKITYLGEPLTPTVMTLNHKFNGTGPQAGLDAQIDLWCGVSLIGMFGFALPVGTEKEVDTEVDAATTVDSTCATVKNVIKPVLDTNFGIRYDAIIKEKVDLRIQIGWEAHIIPNLIVWGTNNDLSLSGLFISGQLYF